MNKATDKPSEDTPGRLLDAAEALFAQHGFDGATIRMITERANANPASVNYYFATKDALFSEVARRKILSLRELIHEAARAEGPFEDRFRTLIGKVLDRLWQDRKMVRIIADDLLHDRGRVPESAGREVPRNIRSMAALLDRAVAEGAIAPCNTRMAVLSIMGPLLHLCTFGAAMGPAAGLNLEDASVRAAFADQHVRLLLDGLRRHGERA